MKLGLPIQWFIGGILLLVGGALSAIGAAIFNFGPMSPGTLITFVAVPLEGAGLITVSFGFGVAGVPVWARRLLFVSGILVLLALLATLLEAVIPSVAVEVLAINFVATAACLLISTLGIYRGIPDGRPVRWALLPVAIFDVIDALLIFGGAGGGWWTLAILGVLYILAGVIFIRSGRRSPAR